MKNKHFYITLIVLTALILLALIFLGESFLIRMAAALFLGERVGLICVGVAEYFKGKNEKNDTNKN